MSSWSSELKVGVFVILGTVLTVGSWMWSYDGVRSDEASYTLTMDVPSADGLFKGTPVRLAGVEVGSIDSVAIAGSRARLVLRIREDYKLSTDSQAELKSVGILGDYFVRVYPGVEDGLLLDGDRLDVRSDPADFDQITRNAQTISDDIAAITKILRQMAENDANRQHIEATLANIDGLSDEALQIAASNKEDIRAIVMAVRRLTESLEGHTDDIAGDIGNEMDKLEELTDHLDDAAEDLSSITGKVDRGEGTIGALINDDDTINNFNDTVNEANQLIGGINRLRTEVYYTGRWYFGSEPNDPQTFFYGNPLHMTGSNTVGLRLRAQEDFWYTFEINDYPTGVIRRKQTVVEETGQVETRWINEARFRFTFQMEKRWRALSFRLGIKEGGGGIGMSVYAFKDRLRLDADVFDFFFGSYPAIQNSGVPNVRVAARVTPIRNLYIEAGMEQIPLGIMYGYATGYAGLGFQFTDDDIKWLFATLPLAF